jgi:polyisoprenoid-binding protein YceI
MNMAKWKLDPSHSSVTFSVRHMMITNVRGEFGKATATLDYDPASPAKTKLEAEVETASINTREEKRDGHLSSGDFFDSEKHPTMTFVSKEARAAKDGIDLIGDLTIRGTTRPVTLHMADITAESKDPWGNTRIGAHAKGTIKRSEFGMTWNQALEAGGILVGDDVKIEIDASLIKA